MSNSKCQDLANDLATAVRKRYIEITAFAGIFMAFKVNEGRSKVTSLHEGDVFPEIQPEHMKPYQDALNLANEEVWALLKKAYFEGCIPKHPGKVPKASYDPNKKCTASCKNARGWDCSCFGSNHSINRY